jgi:hypothetical protein
LKKPQKSSLASLVKQNWLGSVSRRFLFEYIVLRLLVPTLLHAIFQRVSQLRLIAGRLLEKFTCNAVWVDAIHFPIHTRLNGVLTPQIDELGSSRQIGSWHLMGRQV